MSLFIITLFLLVDTTTKHNMNMSYILAKSSVFGFMVFFTLMSYGQVDFIDAIILSTAAIVVNFFVCLLVNLNLFILYKFNKLTVISIGISFLVGYVFVFLIIEYLKGI